MLIGAAAYATARINLRTPDTLLSNYTFSPFETQVEGYEEITLRTADGLRLSAWWLPRPDSRRVVVGLAGHRSPKSDCSASAAGCGARATTSCCSIGARAGRAMIAQHSLAYYELRDAEAAVAYALEARARCAAGADRLFDGRVGGASCWRRASRVSRRSSPTAHSPASPRWWPTARHAAPAAGSPGRARWPMR